MNHVTLIWDVSTRQLVGRYNDHTHFVQGVSWDPFGGLLATQSSDRSVRLYADKDAGKGKKRKLGAKPNLPGRGGDPSTMKSVKKITNVAVMEEVPAPAAEVDAKGGAEEPSRGMEGDAPGTAAAPAADAVFKKKAGPQLFADETVPSFFRRLDWTPDGSFLVRARRSLVLARALATATAADLRSPRRRLRHRLTPPHSPHDLRSCPPGP